MKHIAHGVLDLRIEENGVNKVVEASSGPGNLISFAVRDSTLEEREVFSQPE